MPSDIRSFFGGKPGATPAATPKMPEARRKARGRKVVDDDEDDEPIGKVLITPKKAAKHVETEEVVEETTASDYFGKAGKPKRSDEVTRPKTRGKPKAEEETPKQKSAPSKSTRIIEEETTQKKSTPVKPQANRTPALKQGTPNGRASSRKEASTSYVELDENDFPDDDLEEDAADIFEAAAEIGRRAGDDYVEATSEDEDDVPLRPQTRGSAKPTRLKGGDSDVDMKDTAPEDELVVPEADEAMGEKKPPPKPNAGTKRKSASRDEDDEDDGETEEAKPKKKRAPPTKKATPATKKAKREEPQDSAAMKDIFDSITTIEPPPPPPKAGDAEGEKKKFQYGQHANSAVPAAALDINELPQGAENCLAGLNFVFTGQLDRLSREQGQNLVKQYGGKVTGAPSKKTSYVVLGAEAGPKKLQTIKDYGLKVINEEGLFQLIGRLPANGGDSAAAEKQAEKRAKEDETIRKMAADMEKQERATLGTKPKPSKAATNGNLASAGASQSKSSAKANAAGPDTRLWTVRYAPQQLTQICGNKAQVDKLGRWLRAFPKNQKTKFKMLGPDGSGVHRAVMIHGPPGIGKTTAAHLVAKLEGYDIVESNASDTRSKKLVESGLTGVLSTTSLLGYFGQGTSDVEIGKKKLVLIMDEVDGMSAGDRGGVGALAAVCKKTQIPMILICNDRKLPKMKPFDFVTYDLPFRRPTTDMIRSRISTIAFREGLKIPPNVINALIEGSGADIRQVVNMISAAKLDARESLDFADGTDMSKAWEKHTVLKPWDITGKILAGGLFAPASTASLNDKIDLYFNDHDFSPLMLQENYLGTNPSRASTAHTPQRKALEVLTLASRAADSISDGDLVDRMIHGSQPQWSLMPAHAIMSFVRPASFVAGSMAGHPTRFTAWLGRNSSQGRLTRMVRELHGHMRLRTSGDRHEIRQHYLPLLWSRLVKRLELEGREAVPGVIELMDAYFLTRDDWDAILELGVGEEDMERVRLESQTKAAFTRMYNQQAHPLPFMKAAGVLAPKKAARDRPDLEEALGDSDEGEALVDAAAAADVDDEDGDLSKDKYVKQPKKRKAAPAKKDGKAGAVEKGSNGTAKGKRKKVDDEEEGGGESDGVRKAGRGKGKSRK